MTALVREPHRTEATDVPAFAVDELVEPSTHLLLWQVRGLSRCRAGESRLLVRAGSALWIPAGVPHGFRIGRNAAMLPMFFDSRAVRCPVREPMLLPIREQDKTLCLALVSSQYTLIQPGAALVDAVLAMVEVHASAPDGVPMPHSRTALQVARCLVLNPADRRTLQQWAAELHLSRRSLERAFLAETGLPWKRWRQACRMMKAAQFLRDTDEPVTWIAQRVGFDTHSSFARAFREYHRVTPTAYRGMVDE